jgi:hypothetical protein
MFQPFQLPCFLHSKIVKKFSDSISIKRLFPGLTSYICQLIIQQHSYHSNAVFKLQKRIIRIMVGIRDRESCRDYFRKLKILPLQSQYIYLLLLFVINDRQHFKINSHIHNINAKINLDLHYPLSHLSVYQKGVHYTGIKVFNRLPAPIKQLCLT